MAPKSKHDMATQEAQNGVVDNSQAPFLRMLRDMAAVATAEAEDASFMGDALAAIYNAEDDDEIWDADMSGPLNATHLADCELDLYDLAVKFSRSARTDISTPWIAPDGKKMYLLVTCTRISNAGAKKHINLPKPGEQFQFNTSAQFLAAKLFTFWSRGRFGSGIVMSAKIQSTDLGDGQAVLKLVRVPERTLRHVAETVNDSPEPDNYETVPETLQTEETEPPF